MDYKVALSILDDVANKFGKDSGLAKTTASILRMEPKEKVVDMATLEIISTVRLQVDCGYDRMEPKGLYLFVDGSCTRNGQVGAKAGYGVYIVRDGKELVRQGVKLPEEEPQTNQRAELRGLFYALTYLAESGSAGTIYTDSKYSIDCLKAWAPKWIKNGWRKADKKPVLHDDILKPMYDLWMQLKEQVQLLHVEAHTGKSDFISRGNAVADKLANGSASMQDIM
jgi:ribonuclease HI